jgi:hypothetical protein
MRSTLQWQIEAKLYFRIQFPASFRKTFRLNSNLLMATTGTVLPAGRKCKERLHPKTQRRTPHAHLQPLSDIYEIRNFRIDLPKLLQPGNPQRVVIAAVKPTNPTAAS